MGIPKKIRSKFEFLAISIVITYFPVFVDILNLS
jgi:hypothetical protein